LSLSDLGHTVGSVAAEDPETEAIFTNPITAEMTRRKERTLRSNDRKLWMTLGEAA
jgi:hypothetical protein